VTDSYQRPRPGPGKPLTAQRGLYLRLMKQGFSSAEACRQVGINIRTGKRWRFGRRMRVGGREYIYSPIAAAPQEISARFLSENERLHIADLHRGGVSVRAIAMKLGRSPSTISRELRRNADPVSGVYHPYAAHRRAAGRESPWK
jgi:IS30 family transposase